MGRKPFVERLIRPGRNQFPFTPALAERLAQVFTAYEPDFEEIVEQIRRLPSTLSRFERTGIVSYDDILSIGAVGMAARMSGLTRDIRSTILFYLYNEMKHEPVIKHHGDVYSRFQIRRNEIRQSIKYIKEMLDNVPDATSEVNNLENALPNAFSIALVEGWRGEICHCAVTDNKGELLIYKIKDPSFHNWLALALAVRNNEILIFQFATKVLTFRMLVTIC
jgi:Ni,Fe-hydrogenase III large subunit